MSQYLNAMKKRLLAVFCTILATLANAAPDFKITNEQRQGLQERTVKVQISERLRKSEISEIAKSIYEPGYSRTYIHYHLEGHREKNTWAVSNYLPNLKVEIFGLDKDSYRRLLNHKVTYEGEAVGRWIKEGATNYRLTIIRSLRGQYQEHLYFDDASEGIQSLEPKILNGEQRYYRAGMRHRGSYYKISADGWLQYWDAERGMYDQAAPVK